MTGSKTVDERTITAKTEGHHDTQIDDRTQTLHIVHESAKDALEAGDKSQCRKICLELNRDTNLPLSTRCSIYHMLAQCSGPEKVEYYLNLAYSLIHILIENEDKGYLLREENDALREALCGELFETSDGEDAIKRDAEGEEEEESEGGEDGRAEKKRMRGF